MPPNTEEDKVRGLSPYDLRRILGDETVAGVKLLGKKSDNTFENIKSDDEGRLQVYDPKVTSQTDKLAGETPVSSSTTADWNTDEANIVSIGADNTKYKLHSLLLNISALDNDGAGGSAITIRMYMEVKGTERKVYEQTFIQGTDPDGLWIVNGTLGIHEVLRVTAQSDKATDNGEAIDYDYMLEAM